MSEKPWAIRLRETLVEDSDCIARSIYQRIVQDFVRLDHRALLMTPLSDKWRIELMGFCLI